MSKFTITVDNAQIERFILNMLSLFKNNPEVDFKKDGNNFTIMTNESENMMLEGAPMTWEELISEVDVSENDYENGRYLTSNELKDEVKNW